MIALLMGKGFICLALFWWSICLLSLPKNRLLFNSIELRRQMWQYARFETINQRFGHCTLWSKCFFGLGCRYLDPRFLGPINMLGYIWIPVDPCSSVDDLKMSYLSTFGCWNQLICRTAISPVVSPRRKCPRTRNLGGKMGRSMRASQW